MKWYERTLTNTEKIYREKDDENKTDSKNYLYYFPSGQVDAEIRGQEIPKNLKNVLEYFPEYNDTKNQYPVFITDNGLVAFRKSKEEDKDGNIHFKYIIYDMFENDNAKEYDSLNNILDDITPDTDLNQKYTLLNNPLNVRRINVKYSRSNNTLIFKVIPDREFYKDGYYFCQINCDSIKNFTQEETLEKDNNFFKYQTKNAIPDINLIDISFSYKPLYILRNIDNGKIKDKPADGINNVAFTFKEAISIIPSPIQDSVWHLEVL